MSFWASVFVDICVLAGQGLVDGFLGNTETSLMTMKKSYLKFPLFFSCKL